MTTIFGMIIPQYVMRDRIRPDVNPEIELNVRSRGLLSVADFEIFANFEGVGEVDVFHSRFLEIGPEIVLDVSFDA